jgi:nitrate reductase gamma subunit
MSFGDLLFGVYPYICLTVFFVGSWLRFDREQYSWKADSSQLLDKKNLRLASNLFHVGVLAIFGGHAVGLMIPHGLFLAAGISDMTHQLIAMGAGTIFGTSALIGGVMLWLRRTNNPRVAAAGRKSDKFVLAMVLTTLIVGLITIPVSMAHVNDNDPSVMIALAAWVQSIIYFHPTPGTLDNVDLVFKIHLFLGMTVFLIFPFTRLVHIWSAPFTYLKRPYQIVRSKRYPAK